MDRRSRRFPFFEDFDNFGFSMDIDRMIREMDEMMAQARSNPDFTEGKPIYYGYLLALYLLV